MYKPALEGGSGRCRHLLLLIFYPDVARAASIEGSAAQDFLHEFYRALGVQQPDRDVEFLAMTKQLTDTLPLKAL